MLHAKADWQRRNIVRNEGIEKKILNIRADNANLCLNNSRYPAQPHPIIIKYSLSQTVKIIDFKRN